MVGVQKEITTSRRGYLYVVLAAVMWGVSGVASKFLFNAGISPYQLVQLRITIAAVSLLLWLLVRQPALLRIDGNGHAILGSFGILLRQNGVYTCVWTPRARSFSGV